MDAKTRNIVALGVIAVITAVSVWQFWPLSEKITQGLDLKGGLSVILTAEPLGKEALTEDVVQRVEDILVERVNGFGISEASVQRQGQNAFLIQLPGIKNAKDALKLLGEPGKLEFVHLSTVTDTATLDLMGRQIAADRSTETTATLPKLDPTKYTAFMTGEVITDAKVTADKIGNPAVSLTMSKAGAATWAEVTTRLAPTRGAIAIVLDGRTKSAPEVQSPILSGDT